MSTLHSLTVLFCLAVLLAGGCTRIPQPSGYPFVEQQKMQAAFHWEVLANDVANQINLALIEHGFLETPVYVRRSCERSGNCRDASFPFDEGFNDLLATQLVSFGVPTLAENDESGLVVDYKVQVLFHQATRYQWPWPGALTALTAGILVFRNAPAELATLVSAAAADVARTTSVINGHYEVIISTSIVRDNRYVMRKSDVYYINDPDFWHYQQSEPASEIELTGSRF